jgi:hypothetical protein
MKEKELKNKRILLKILEPVWGLDANEVKPLIAAVESGDRTKIEECIRSLEEMVANKKEDDIPYDAKKYYRVWETEIQAKIAVLRAIINREASDWEAASVAYNKLKNALESLAYRYPEGDIARILYEYDAKHAEELATLCLFVLNILKKAKN